MLRKFVEKSVKQIVSEASRSFDAVIGFGRVTGSSLGDNNGSILYDIEGVGFDANNTQDPAFTTDNSEIRSQQEVYSALGVVGRPPASAPGDYPDLLLQTMHARVSDGSIPFAFRDPRILKWLNVGGAKTVPKEGQTAFAGYGGSFLSFETLDESNGPTNICVLYCPYSRDENGVPQKAHMFMLDPTAGNESIALVHAEGLAITMTKENGIVMTAGPTTMLSIAPGKILGVAAAVSLQGSVSLGANPALAVPLLPGVASPPSLSVFVSP
jgi:hypothetical protein